MASPISSVASSLAATVSSAATAAPGAGTGFTKSLTKLLESVEESSGAANVAVGNMLSGTGDVHDAMIALQRAESTFELTVQVRNKLVQAYQDIMRMPV